VGVDHPRHDREARTVDYLSARLGIRSDVRDPPAGHDDVGAAKLSRTDID
jgi:hypothetical protein